ncbi:DoxX family protein [Streptomonospora sediminis]
MKYLVRSNPVLNDAVFLLLRICIGVVFIGHGWDRLANMDVARAAHIAPGLREMGIPLPDLVAPYLAYGEPICGALVLLGVLTRLGAAVLTFNMLGAWFFVHSSAGLMVANNGYEYVMVLSAVGLLLVVCGPGRFSIDALLARAGGSDGSGADRPAHRAGAA